LLEALMARYAALATFAAALAASVALAIVPTGLRRTVSVSGAADGVKTSTVTTVERTTLLESDGRSVLILLAVPVSVAAGALVRQPRAGLAGACVLTIFCLLGAMSIGFAYVPAAVLAWIAAGSERRAIA
jgi:hypothetical protein